MEFSTILTLVAMASMSTGTDGCIGQPELSFKTTPSNDKGSDCKLEDDNAVPSNDGSIDHGNILPLWK